MRTRYNICKDYLNIFDHIFHFPSTDTGEGKEKSNGRQPLDEGIVSNACRVQALCSQEEDDVVRTPPKLPHTALISPYTHIFNCSFRAFNFSTVLKVKKMPNLKRYVARTWSKRKISHSDHSTLLKVCKKHSKQDPESLTRRAGCCKTNSS